MKPPLTITLGILLAALCALCIFQWRREAGFRSAIVDLSGKLHAETKGRTESEARSATLLTEIQRLESLRAGTEAKYLAALDELRPLQADLAARGLTIGILSELAAAAPAADNQNAVIAKQNELLKSLAAERDAAIAKLNARTREWNALTEKYNEAVRRR